MAKMEKISKISQQLTPDEMDGIRFIASVFCNKRPDSIIGLYSCVRNKLDFPERFIATILKLAGHVKFADDLCSEDVNEHFEGLRFITADQRKKMKMRALFVRMKQTPTLSSVEKMTEFGQTLICKSGLDTNYENCSRSYELFQLLEEKGCVHVKDSNGLKVIKETLLILQYTEVLELVDDFIKQEWPQNQPICYTRNPDDRTSECPQNQPMCYTRNPDDRTSDPPPYHPPVMPHMYRQQRSCPPPVGPPPPTSELQRYNSSPGPHHELSLQHQNQPSHGLHVPSTLPFSNTHQAQSGAQNRQHREPIHTNTQSSNPFFPAVPMSFPKPSSSSSPYYQQPAPTYDDRYHNVQGSGPSFQYTPHDQFYREIPHFVNNSNCMPPQPHQLSSTRQRAYPSHHQVYQSEGSHLAQAQYGRQHSSPNNEHVVKSVVSPNVVQCTSQSPVFHRELLVQTPQSKIGQYQQPAHYQQSSHSTRPSNMHYMPHWSTKQPTAQFPPPVRQCSNDSVPQSLVTRRQHYSDAGHSKSFPPQSVKPQYSKITQQSSSVQQYQSAIPSHVTEQPLHQDHVSMGPSDLSLPYDIDAITENNRDTK